MTLSRLVTRSLPALLGCSLLLAGILPPRDPELAVAEKVLGDHAVATDGPGLLGYFARLKLAPAERARILAHIRDLGAEDFGVRQEASAAIVRAGAPALPLLKNALTGEADLERLLRCRRCIEAIEEANPPEVTEAAVRVLAARRPPGSVPALLTFLPDCTDEATVGAVRQALVTLARRDGESDPDLLRALDDRAAVCRAAAAYALGRTAPAELPRLRPLLRDRDARVRFEAALALAVGGDRQGVPVLIDLLEENGPLAWQVHDLLLALAGDKAPSFLLPDEPGARRTVQKSWAAWWQAEGERVDLTPLKTGGPPLLGETLFVEASPKNPQALKVWACQADGKERWSWPVEPGVVDIDILPGGRLLLADLNGLRVVERDRSGKVLWEYTAEANPVSCQRLPNGNTFIATNLALLEVNPERKIVQRIAPVPGTTIWHARRLRNGHTFYLTLDNRILEVDQRGQMVGAIPLNLPSNGGGFFEVLPNGRLLVSLCAANLVFEIDPQGRRTREIPVPMPAGAVRLPNGHTLVASLTGKGVQEVDAAGRVVWERKTEGAVWCVRRY